MSLLSTLNKFHTLSWCFLCCHWASKFRLVIIDFFGFQSKAVEKKLINTWSLGITSLFSKSNMTLLKLISTFKKLFQVICCTSKYFMKIYIQLLQEMVWRINITFVKHLPIVYYCKCVCEMAFFWSFCLVRYLDLTFQSSTKIAG